MNDNDNDNNNNNNNNEVVAFDIQHALYTTAVGTVNGEIPQDEGRYIVDHAILVICDDQFVVCEKEEYDELGFCRESWKCEIPFHIILPPINFSLIVSEGGNHKLGKVVINIHDTNKGEAGRYTFKMPRETMAQFRKEFEDQLARLDDDEEEEEEYEEYEEQQDQEYVYQEEVFHQREDYEVVHNETQQAQQRQRPDFVDRIYANPMYMILDGMSIAIVAVVESLKTLFVLFAKYLFPFLKSCICNIFSMVHGLFKKVYQQLKKKENND